MEWYKILTICVSSFSLVFSIYVFLRRRREYKEWLKEESEKEPLLKTLLKNCNSDSDDKGDDGDGDREDI